MPHWLKVTIAAVVPSTAGVLAWWICVARGLALDTTSIVVGLVVLLPGTPLAIWAGQAKPNTGPEPAPEADRRSAPAVIGEVPREPKAFQPRPDLSKRIDKVFSGHHAAAVCALAGGRGVGKTHLAATYARVCIDQGVPVAWLHAETAGQLHGSVDRMAAELRIRGEGDDAATVTRKVRAWLQERREPYLVVIDNATDPDLLASLLPSHGRARVLITTNDQSFERLATLITVEQFSEEEAVSYLSMRVGGDEGDEFRPLAQELDRLPLALSIAAAALVGPPRLSCASYLVRLRTTPVEVLLTRPRGEPYPRGVAQAIMQSIGEIDPASAHLLGELSALSTSGVGLDLLGAEAQTALSRLAGRSLVTFSRDDTTAFVHRLVRRAVREQAMRDRTLAQLIETAAQRMRAAVEEIPDKDTWRKSPTIMAVAGHATALWEAMEQFGDDDSAHVQPAAEIVLRVWEVAANHLIYLNDDIRAFPIAQSLVAGREKFLPADHPDTLTALFTLARSYPADQASQARELFQHVASERAQVLGDDHPDTLLARSWHAFSHTTAGRPAEALALLDQVVTDQTRLLDPGHPTLLQARFSQAYVCVDAGQPDRAADLFERLAADHERLFGVDSPDALVIRGRVAWAHAAAGRAVEAARLYEVVTTAQERVIGADHPDTLITLHGLAAAYEAAGRADNALTGYEGVAARFEAVMGPEQTLTKTAKADLERVRRSLHHP
ncbi:tetratricopeptide repeat protein [Nonomuraea sp. NPDC048882]|uniref:tetratricopeptide repeat protein n=1 Tax=Nonomuraea sp. NPDC048882 TaxID=3154347 RepID=UPI003410D76E